jgi:hypothetical protein
MDEFFVTNQQFVDFLNHNISQISIESGVAKGNGVNWFLLGKVRSGYEPIIYRNNKFHLSDPAPPFALPVMALRRTLDILAGDYRHRRGEGAPKDKNSLPSVVERFPVRDSRKLVSEQFKAPLSVIELHAYWFIFACSLCGTI